jgi:hypothetical protein
MTTAMNSEKAGPPLGDVLGAELERTIRFAETLLGAGLELLTQGLPEERRSLSVPAVGEVRQRFSALRELGPLLPWTFFAERLRASMRLQRCLLRSALEGQFTQLPYGLDRSYLPSIQVTQSPIWALLAAQQLHGSVIQALSTAARNLDREQSMQDEVLFLLDQARHAKPQTLADLVVTAQISRAVFTWTAELAALVLPRPARQRPPLYPNLESQVDLLKAYCPNFAALSPLTWPSLFAQYPESVPALDANALSLLLTQADLLPIADWTASQLADRIEPRGAAAAGELGGAFERLNPVIFPTGKERLPHPTGAAFLLGFYTKLLLTWRPRIEEYCQIVSGQDLFALLFRDLQDVLDGRDMLLARVASGPLTLAANRLREFLDLRLQDDFERVKISYLQARVMGISAGREVL